MSLQEIFQQVQGWLAGLWSHPIPWWTIILWSGIAAGCFIAGLFLMVLGASNSHDEDHSDAPRPPKGET